MSRHASIFLFLLSSLLPGTPAEGAAAGKPLLWFAPHTPYLPLPAPDFLALFAPHAPWEKAATRVSVFKLYAQFVAMASDEELRQALAGIRQRHLELALECGFVDYTDKALCDGSDPRCGQLESRGGEILPVLLQRLKKFGGDLRYIVMDEPLWFGHVLTKAEDPAAPHAPLAALAANVARQVAKAREIFPAVKIGDSEPLAEVSGINYLARLDQWLHAYRAATRMPLAYLLADVAWNSPAWKTSLPKLAQAAAAHGVELGVFYNGNPASTSGLEWTASAEKNFVAVEEELGLVPAHALIQSWDPQPAYSLPETQPGTMTFLVNRYSAQPSRLQLARQGKMLVGLLSSRGKPLPRAKVRAVEVDGSATYSSSLEGEVPARATTAVVALRVNAECGCKGAADLALGPARYSDQATEKVFPLAPKRVVVSAENKLAENMGSFPVTPGRKFAFSVPMQVPPSSENTGYVAIVFLDAKGGELSRFRLPFLAKRRTVWEGATDSGGKFTLPLSPGTARKLTFEFAGTEKFRLTSASL